MKKTRKQRKAKYYEFNEDGKIKKEIFLNYGIYFDESDKLVLCITMDDKRKTISSAIDIPVKDLFDCLKKHITFEEKEESKSTKELLE